ncbi:10913_t:CDS:10, partial [Ambispora gerdemannii]
ALGRIRVLLVPVHPIKASVFQKHVELVKKFGVVKLGDVTPDMRGVQKTMFSAQAFHEGQLHFNFATRYETEHAYLEEFQLHRKIFGVIGIMDCQEWSNLPDGYSKFSEILKTYPTAIAHRCFAFNPAETQPDDTKGLIMIPNVGNMGFYMSTMICDFASDILTEFGNVAAAIEKKSIIDSPKIPSSNSQNSLPTPQTRHTLPITTTSYLVPELKAPPQLPLTPPSTAMTTAAMGGTTPGVNTKDNLYHSRTFSSTSLANFASQAAMVPSSVADLKLKRRTPGRVQKLIADLYLMSGRLPDAVTHYYNAIDTTRNNSDYLWQAAAIEGLCVALILLAYLHADIGPQVLQAPPSPNTNPPSSPSSPIVPKPLWADITEKYLNVITLYAKTSNSAYNQVPPLVYTESCLKLAKMLSNIWIVGQWGDDALKLIVHGGPPPEKGLSEKWGLSQVSGVTRVEIAQWAMKGYGAFVEEMSITEQIYIATTMASIFSTINFRRKHAFFLRQTALLIVPLLAKPPNSPSPPTNLLLEGGDAGILSCIAKFTDIYGVGDDVKLEKSSASPMLDDEPLLNFGWPEIQIDVLKDAISLSEAIPDLSSSIKYTTRLLRKLFLHLPKEEQHRLTISLPRIVASAKKQGLEMDIKYWGMNIVRGIEVCRPTSRKIPYPHSKKLFSTSEEPIETVDTIFIYNPRGKKIPETVQTHLVANETAYFMVTLANPFAVDLEIQSISISTNGINFKPNIMSTSIPANTSVTLRLSGTPKEAGELVIRGCKIKVYGCSEQEFCIKLYLFEILSSGLAVIDHHRRVDSQCSTSSTATTTSTALTTPTQGEHDLDFLKVEIISDQPLIKIKSTSLMHSAIMLFEGEKTEMTIKLENIGKTPVDFINLSFHDSTIEKAQAILSSPDLPAEEAYEMELYAYRQPVFSWEQTERKVNLLSNNELILNINVFGKRGCTYGTIQIDYGYIDRPDSVSEDIFYTRQVFYPVLLTVHQHLEPLTMDIMNFKPIVNNGSSIINNNNGHIDKSDQKQIEELLKITRFNEKSELELDNEYCLLTFDIRNVWHIPFDVIFSVDEVDTPSQVNVSTSIQPSATTRIILPIKRITLTESEIMKPIPSLFDKQFVVSKEPKGTKEQERLLLSLFWYREFLLKKITATWEYPIGNQKGTIDIRSLRLNKSMLNILRINEISFFVEIQEAPHVVKLSLNRFRCPVNEFVHIRFVVHNRQEKQAKLCIRIQPVLSYSDGLMEYDLSGRLVWNGLLQTPLPKIDAKSSTIYTLPVCFFSRGDFQFLYHCEDILTRTLYFDSQPLLVEAVDKQQ